MSRTPVRFAVLAGAAAVALGVATPVVAAAMEHTTTVASAHRTATPIAHDGRTITVRMPTAHYAVAAAHHDAVKAAATAPPLQDTITGQQPGNGITPAYDQTAPASVSGGTIGAGVVGILVIGVIVYFGAKHKKFSAAWGVTLVALGVLLSGTFIGPLIEQLTTSVVTAAASTLGNL